MNDLLRDLQESQLILRFRDLAPQELCFSAARNVPRGKRSAGYAEHGKIRLGIADGDGVRGSNAREREERSQALAFIASFCGNGRVESSVMHLEPIQAQPR
jgi:hypothetical protein